jgi:hypothetical protein
MRDYRYVVRERLAKDLREEVAAYRVAWWPAQIAKAFRIADLVERNIASIEDSLNGRT